MKAVSFDVWSTLLDIDVFYRFIAEALSEVNGQSPQEVFPSLRKAYSAVKDARRKSLIREDDVVGSSTEVFLGSLGSFSKYELYWAVSRAVNRVPGERLLLPGATEVLESLASQGYRLAVTSNVIFWPGYVTRILLDKSGLGRFFKVQVYADEVKALKPSSKPFLEMLRAIGSEPREAVHVGDSPQEDLAGALNAGMAVILVERDGGQKIIYEKIRIAVVSSLLDVPEAVEHLLKE
ncbi:MAG: HAD family hydrolase [Infirmifilum sp.]